MPLSHRHQAESEVNAASDSDGRRPPRHERARVKREDSQSVAPSRVPAALCVGKKGGRVVCGGIHMSDIPGFPYPILWEERQLVSVANLTRQDAREFLAIAPQAGIKMHVTRYPLADANTMLADLRSGRL